MNAYSAAFNFITYSLRATNPCFKTVFPDIIYSKDRKLRNISQMSYKLRLNLFIVVNNQRVA
ncbi:hypothetical protein GCM10026988_30120 [Vibrio panuliri]